MNAAYRITPELRIKLKEPFGVLVKGTFEQTTAEIKKIVETEKPPFLISVGDTVSVNLEENKIFPHIAIIDHKCMRKDFSGIKLGGQAVYVANPAGTITSEAVDAVKAALKRKNRTTVVVDGEEDLLTLTAVALAPEGAVVVYGQPYEGIVVVRVTPEKKAETAGYLKAMQSAQKS
jgi:GTP-dependent dephospho-CoA kinase